MPWLTEAQDAVRGVLREMLRASPLLTRSQVDEIKPAWKHAKKLVHPPPSVGFALYHAGKVLNAAEAMAPVAGDPMRNACWHLRRVMREAPALEPGDQIGPTAEEC